MRPLIQRFVALYPRPWRERYGQEFAALIEDLDPTPQTALDIFTGALSMQIQKWNLGWMFAIASLAACAAFTALYFSFPKTYVSSGMLKMNGSGPGFDQESLDTIQALTQRVESRKALTNILVSQGLYRRQRTRRPLEDILDQMRRDIKVEPMRMDSSAGFRVSVAYPDPQAAQRVVQTLIANYVQEYFRTAQRDSALRSSLQILDPASLASKPEYPNLWSLAIIAGLAGAASLGILALFGRFKMRPGMRP